MAGFESATQASAAPGFHYASSGPDGYLERCNVPGFDSLYEIISPTYQTLPGQTTIGVGFELSGVVNIGEIQIFIQYTNTFGGISTAWVSQVTPVYSGNTALVCVAIPISALPNYAVGSPYRVHIFMRPTAPSNQNQCIIFDDFRSNGAVSQIILPVSFTNFTARRAGNAVDLNWSVAAEIEVSHYEIEKSTNAKDFTKIGEVTATGSASYKFTDPNPGSNVVFYRVRNVDNDGKYKYTSVVRVNLSSSIRLNAYPLPFRDLLTIEHVMTTGGRITLASASGQLVKSVAVNANMSQTVLQTGDLQPGMYVIRFDNGKGSVETIKVIKQ